MDKDSARDSELSDLTFFKEDLGALYQRRFLLNGNVCFDPKRGELSHVGTGSVCCLTPKSNRLLIVFCHFSDRVLDREFLMDAMWNSNRMVVSDNTLSQSISQLRACFRKIDAETLYIKTINRLGYVFLGSVTELCYKLIDVVEGDSVGSVYPSANPVRLVLQG
jgi:DNA-binding winged helix-turn-helix (wHTH) protein